MNRIPTVSARWLVAILSFCFVAVIAGCDSDPASDPGNVPADHTIRQGGALHKSGYNDPFESNCTACHGADLRGGTALIDGVDVATPSCFSCHGQKWR